VVYSQLLCSSEEKKMKMPQIDIPHQRVLLCQVQVAERYTGDYGKSPGTVDKGRGEERRTS
jgi:hypothetical protein